MTDTASTYPTIDAAWVTAAGKEAAVRAADTSNQHGAVPFQELPASVQGVYLLDAEQAVLAALPVLWEAARDTAVRQVTAAIAAHEAGHPVAAGTTLTEYVTDRLNTVLGDEPVIAG